MLRLKNMGMKKFLGFLLLVVSLTFTLVFTGCGDKDEESIFIAAELPGTWTSESASVSATINDKELTQFLKDNGASQAEIDELEDELQTFGEDYVQWTITFNEDNSITSQYEGETETGGTWTLNEDDQTLSLNTEEVVGTEFENLFTFDVLHLDDSKMSLLWGFQFDDFFGEGVEIDFDQDGTPDTFRLEIIMNFTK